MNLQTTIHECERLLVELHRLMRKGEGDSAEADRIRDCLDQASLGLAAPERTRLSWLSADLYMIAGEEVVPEELESLTETEVAEAVREAFPRGDWETTLHFLRGPRTNLQAGRVAYVRARCWSGLGFHEAAICFYEHAHRLEGNPNYLALLLDEQVAAGRVEEAARRASEFEKDPSAHASLLLKAALVLFSSQTERADERAAALVQRARACAEWGSTLASLRAAGLVAAAFASGHLGNLDVARALLDEAVSIYPMDAAYVARGLLTLDDEQARRDFEAAVKQGTSLALPYLLLAESALREGSFKRVEELASMGVHLRGDGALRARLFEWWAIAGSHLAYTEESIRALLNAAQAEHPFDRELDVLVEALSEAKVLMRPSPPSHPPSRLEALGDLARSARTTLLAYGSLPVH